MSRLRFVPLGAAALLLCSATPHLQTQSRSVENFRLLDHQGKSHELYRYSDARAIVFITQGNGCPIVRKSLPTLRSLRDTFSAEKVVFFMLNVNAHDDRAAVALEALEFGIDLPILLDPTQTIARSLGLTRTAEVLLIDPAQWRVLYQGAIDDRLDYGVEKPQARRTYLADALRAWLKNMAIETAQTQVKGCLISYPPPQPISYARQIAPILKSKCLNCHAEGGFPPFLKSYEQVRGWAPMIRETLRTGRMPPWHADSMHGKFRNDISLSSEQRRTLIEWIEQGTPRGQGQDLLLRPARTPADWPLGPPDIVLTMMEEQSIPPTGPLPYRYVQMGGQIPRDLWVKTVHIRPSNRGVVHHAGMFAMPAPLPKHQDMRDVDGFRILSLVDRKFWFGDWYFVGTHQPEISSDGIAAFLPQGTYPVIELHYQSTGKPEIDRTQVGLYLHNGKRPKRKLLMRIQNEGLNIPPGAKEYEASAAQTVEQDILLLAFYPHMHLRGQRMKYTARYPDNRQEILLSVPQYDFYWQRPYVLSEPKRLPAGTSILVEAAYDNSVQNPANPDPNQRVTFGLQSNSEMLMGLIVYVKDAR